jgi:zinc transporter ZupT
MGDDVLLVAGYGLLTALATGLGALPFAFVRHLSPRVEATAGAVAAGLMLGASFGLLAEGSRHGAWQTVVGVQLGIVFVFVAHRWLEEADVSFEEVTGDPARRMFLMVMVMTVHSFSEGVAIGASFGGGVELAFLITVAIAVHNVPEGIAISAVLRPQGTSVARCAGWSVFSSLPQPVMAVPAFLLVEAVRPALPYGIGFAAGAMVFMVFLELLPESFEEAPRWSIGLVTSFSLVLMLLFQRSI